MNRISMKQIVCLVKISFRFVTNLNMVDNMKLRSVWGIAHHFSPSSSQANESCRGFMDL